MRIFHPFDMFLHQSLKQFTIHSICCKYVMMK